MEQRVRENMKGEGVGRVCEEFSAGYYGICTMGGMFSAGTTHLVTTPLDVLKVNMQVCCFIYNLLILYWVLFSFLECEAFLFF